MTRHYPDSVTAGMATTLCGVQVMASWTTKRHLAVDCQKCKARLQLQVLQCQRCKWQGQLGKTRVTRSFLRLCPECKVDHLAMALLDGKPVRMPPAWWLAGLAVEDEEQRQGIRMKENQ